MLDETPVENNPGYVDMTETNLLLQQIVDLNIWLFAAAFALIGMLGILIFFVAKGDS